jgi:hypothetical protein
MGKGVRCLFSTIKCIKIEISDPNGVSRGSTLTKILTFLEGWFFKFPLFKGGLA